MTGTTTRRIPATIGRTVAILTLAAVGISGCYTVLRHPTVAPEQQVSEAGDVVRSNDCESCHTLAQVWDYHHYQRYGTVSSHSGSLLWDYYYNYHDPYFVSRRWYADRYYDRWMAYHHTPWWHWSTNGVPVAQTPEEPAVGRGAVRDGYDGVNPRPGSFSGTYPNAAPMLRVPTSSGGSTTNTRPTPNTTTPTTDSGRPEVTTERGTPATTTTRSSETRQTTRGDRGRGSSGSQKTARQDSSSDSDDSESDSGRSSESRSR